MLPEKPKLKFVNKVPNLKKAKKEMKKLRDIQGPAKAANTFTTGQYAIVVSAFIFYIGYISCSVLEIAFNIKPSVTVLLKVSSLFLRLSDAQALGGGYLHWGHIEMIRLTINRKMDSRTTFARWRINGPYKPITRKGLGQRMGGGKGAIDHYVTPVRYGRLVVEVGGKVELEEVEHILTEVARKLPFPAKVRWQIQFSIYFASCGHSRVSINVTWILRSKSDD